MEWKEVKILEIAHLKNGKKRPSNSGSFPVYGGNGIMDYVDSYNEDNVIIIGRVGAYCGCVYYCDSKCWISDNAISAKAKEDTDNVFLYYLLSNQKLNHHRIGGAQPLMTQDLIGRISVIVPEKKDDQRRIANILSSLDRKIELNNKINAQLEEMAQTLFKHWFVDFRPFKDGKFVESELGMIPEGWRVTKIGETSHSLETGKRPKGGVGEITHGIPSVGADNVKGLGIFDYSKVKYISEDFAKTVKKGWVKGYELLIYKDGGTPGNFIPHFSIMGEGFPYDKFCLNEHVFKLDFFDRKYNAFAYFYFNTEQIKNYLNVVGGKAAIPGINQGNVEDILIFENNEEIQKWGNMVLPIITKILQNCKQNQKLATLRDTLLPKLMSGEINIEDYGGE